MRRLDCWLCTDFFALTIDTIGRAENLLIHNVSSVIYVILMIEVADELNSLTTGYVINLFFLCYRVKKRRCNIFEEMRTMQIIHDVIFFVYPL